MAEERSTALEQVASLEAECDVALAERAAMEEDRSAALAQVTRHGIKSFVEERAPA